AVNWRSPLCGALAAVAAWLLAQAYVMRGLENWMLDGCFDFRGTRPSAARVLIVGLDDVSLNELRKPLCFLSPELAEALRYLKNRRAAAVGIDLVVPDVLDALDDLQAGRPGDASTLGQAVQESGNVVLAEWKSRDGWLRPLSAWRLKSYLNPEATDL